MRRSKAALLLVLLAVLIVPAAWAQTTTSSIRGVVRDDSGPLTDATIEAVAVGSGFKYTAKTGPDGSFSLAGLAPGVYTLSVSSPAYAAQKRDVQVLVGQDVEAEFVLSPGEVFTENVTVVGESVQLLVETRTSEIGTNITQQQIESLPQNNRNFLGLAALAPGVRFTDNQDDSAKFRSGGADSRQINVFVDGLSYKNDLLQGGAFMQDSSRGNPFPLNAVQEFRVLTQNYKAEYEKAAAAVITAVTKSGGNNFHGELLYLTQDKGLVEQDDFSRDRGEEKPDYDRTQIGAALGGPILHDRLHFFASYERNEQDRNAAVFRGGSFDSAPANVRQFLGQFETGNLTSPFESNLYFGKLSWQPTEGQTFFTTFHRRDEQEIKGFGGQRTRDGAESFEIGSDSLVAKHSWVIGSNVLNEVSGTFQKLQWNPTAINSTEPRLNYIGILDVGGKDATQDFKQDKIGLRDDVSWALSWRGTHTLKAGVGVNWLDYQVTKNTFENGLFEFRSDEQWQFPFQARVGFGDPSLDFSNTQAGLYLQDDWQIGSNLTLNLGVRWDYESNMINNDFRTPPELVASLQSACRTYGAPVGGQSTWCLRDFLDLSRFTTDGDDRDPYYGMVQPRLGFAWDVSGNAKTVVFGGWGKYYDRVVLNDIFDEQYRQQFKIYSFCFSADGSPAPNCSVPALAWRPEFLSGEALRQLVASGQAPGPEIFLVDNELRPPRSDQWTLGVRHQFGNWLTSLAYAGTRGYNGIIYFFGDLPPGTRFEDRFGNNVGVPGFARVFTTSTARRTWYDGIYFTLDRPLAADSRWGFNLAYTYSDAEQNGTDNPFEGIVFGAFDYLDDDSLYRFPASNNEEHRLVMSGTVALPANFQLSSIITLGSGVPYTIFDDSVAPFRVRWNEGEPPKEDFIIPDAWGYRSVDLRLEWQAPPIANAVRISLIAEGFNVFDFDNYNDFSRDIPRLPNVNADFGEPRTEFNARRFQAGVRVAF